MGKERRVLGRGLDALIPSVRGSSLDVPLDEIVPSRSQPRTRFDEAALGELADSIRIHGVLQPLVVSPVDAKGKRRLIAGERRWQAARMAGLDRVPVVEREAAPQAAVEIALIENIQRENLAPLEEAAAFDRLSREYGLTQEQIAQRVGRSRSSIANSVRLLNLPAKLREALDSGVISTAHARALLGLESAQLMESALDRVIRTDLNVRQTERLVAALRAGPMPPVRDRKQLPELAQLETELRSRFGTKVSVVNGRKAGRIVIEYYSAEELTVLADMLLGGEESKA